MIAGTMNAFGQGEIYLNEDFEHDGSMPEGWSQIYLGNIYEKPDDLAWEAREGGGKPAGSEVTKPEHAHNGDYNARLYYLAVEHMHSMYLVSPIINFENAHKPLLTFWYSQYKDRASATDSSEIDNFEISLYYRILESADTTWQKIRDYQSPTDDDEPWKCDSIWLPEIMTGKKKIQVAFLGKTKTLGHGCCLDDIKIEETQITNKYVGNITATHPTTDIIPTSTDDNTILRMRVQILGNSGVFNLNTLTATVSQLKQKGNIQEPINAIKTNGIKLYYTESDIFTTDNLLATTSVANGKATFNNIGFDMPAGYNYLWIACDIDDDNEHRFRNVKIDMKIEPESINIGGLKYPASVLDPAGDRTINESIFVDDFENASRTNNQWPIWSGEFERAQTQKETNPTYVAGNTHGGNANPTYPHGGGNWIIGTDITGKGENPGGIETGVGSADNYVETKPFDCYYYKGISLIFYRWLNICDLDTAYVSISTDEGTTWENVWTSTSTILNKSWTYQNLDLKNVADRTPNIKLRFALGSADREQNMLAYSGWNIDDVALVGTFVYMDAAVTDIVYPITDCGLDKVKPVIKIKNAGFNKIETPFKASYSIDGGETWTEETVTAQIEREDEIEYQFNTEADLSVPGWYDIRTRVTLTDDEDLRNNNSQKRIISLPTIKPAINQPYTENFGTYGYWYSEDDTWQYTKPENASYCWTTKSGNSTCTLESPCFDLSDVQKPIIEFMMKGNSSSTDGLALYYSTDAGHQTWNLVPAYPTAYHHPSWEWYNTDDVDALDNAGWSGDEIDNWARYMQLLPDDTGGKSSVKLKFVFKAEDTGSDYNFAIDDFKLYESPVDAGVISIVSPVSACKLSEDQEITISIKNYGIRAITPSDSIIASVTVNDKVTLTDTFFVAEIVAKNGTFEHTFGQTVNMWYKKTYNMTATTLINGDTLLFNNPNAAFTTATNDSKSASADVWGEPLYDLGADMGTTNPATTTLNGGVKANGTNFSGYKWFASKEAFLAGTPTAGEEKTLTGLRPFDTGESEYYYYIEVTGEHGCKETDSIKIINSNIDVGIASVSGIADNDKFCRNKVFDNVKVTIDVENRNNIENKEDFGIGIGYKMLDDDNNLVSHVETVYYKALNTNTFVSHVNPEDEAYPENLAAHQSISFVYTFEQQPKFEYDNEQNIEFYTVIWADLDHSNNSITKNVTVWPLPTADITMDDIAYDSILIANPVGKTLKTENIANATYTWQDNSTESEIEIDSDQTKEYSVSVKNNCATVTDKVLVVTDNWKLADLLSPTDNCDPQSDVDVTVRIENNSPNIYPAGYKIPATVTFNGNTFNEIITLAKKVEAYDSDPETVEDQFVFTFQNKVNMPAIEAYNISVKINPEHDINRNDNTINQEVDIWGTPRLNIGSDTIFTLRPDTVRLRISSSFNGCHWFFDNSTKPDEDSEDKLVITPSCITCHVFAINEHECYASDQKTDNYAHYKKYTKTGYCATDTVVIIKSDISIENIESPIAACDIESFNIVKLTLRNSGLDVIANGTQLPIMVKIGDNVPVRKEFVIQAPFDPYDITETDLAAVIPFDFNFNKNETYSVTAWLDWNLDRFNKNDTIRTVVSQYPTPEPFTLGDDIYTTNPDTVVLHAPENYYNYSWSGGQSNTDVLAVSYIGTRTYGVKVSNQYGCSYSDSVVVSLTNPEIDITDLGFSTDICESTSLSNVSFTLKNIGEDIIARGSQIDIEYSINGAAPVGETYKVGRTLNSDESVTITFKQQADFHAAGNYSLNITARIADTVAVASKDYTITVHESPNVSLGKDIATFEQSVTLNAGAGFNSYLWSTGATTDKIEVSTDGNYWVTATNAYGCKKSDTVYVRLIPATVTVFELKSPKSACSLNNEPIKISIVNNGTTKIEKGNTISVKCIFDNDSSFSVSNPLPFDLEQKGQLEPNMGSISTNNPGQHSLAFVISIEGVVIDSSVFEFEVYGAPDFDFENETIEVDSYPYTLTTTSPLSNVTYEWDNKATTNAIEVNADGTHSLTVTDSHKCAATKSVTVKKKATGISNSSIADIAVYPNPARDIVNIDFNGMMTKGSQILIANASGQIIFASKQTSDIMQINVDDWAQGLYFIKVTSNHESRIMKFVKE